MKFSGLTKRGLCNLNSKTLEECNEGEIWNCRSESDRLCLRISSANSGTIQEILTTTAAGSPNIPHSYN